MKRAWMLIGVCVLALILALAAPTPQASTTNESGTNSPAYTADGNLKFPAQYREWVYVTSGVDMSYGPGADMEHSMFDNVFVNPEAYKAFLQTGTWPDKTMLVLEVRMAGSKGSINKNCGAKMYLNSGALTNGSFADVVGRLKNDLQRYGLELGPLAECAK